METLANVLPHLLPEDWRSKRYVPWLPSSSPSRGRVPSQTWMIALWSHISSRLEQEEQTSGPRIVTDIIREHLLDAMPIVPVKMRFATHDDVTRAVVVLSSRSSVVHFGLSDGQDSGMSESVLDSVSALGIAALGTSNPASLSLRTVSQSHARTTNPHIAHCATH